jgi:protein phosphatase
MMISLPEPSLVVLIGATGSGKSSFAARHFKRTEVLSSDFCRGLVADDENDQSATIAAFDVLHHIAGHRLGAGRLTVVDATNVQRESRKPLLALARAHDLFCVAMVLDLPERLCADRNRGRPDRQFGPHVLRQQRSQLKRSLRGLQREGFRYVHVLRTPEEVEAVAFERVPLWTDRRGERGPFDVIGDVHGCRTELDALLCELGYAVDGDVVIPPPGRRAVFVGDLVDRGPDTPGVLRLVIGMVEAGTALCVPGNHDVKLVRKLRGRDVQISHGLAESLAQLEPLGPEFAERARTFLDGLVSHLVLHDGELVVAHAGMREAMQGRASGRVRDFALYGETTGETDELGLPVRSRWAADYRGRALVAYGHTPVPEPEWLNNTVNLDTGCVFGGRLTALRWPERELVSVPAAATHYEPLRPLAPAADGIPRLGEQLDLGDVLGKRIVTTRLARSVTVRAENAAAALEVMSRFAVDPRWLVHLPPTMAPPATSRLPGLLEHPAEAFAEYRHEGVGRVVCEEKHMGSRAIAIACRDADAAQARFGAGDGRAGVVYTRTGRAFFADPALEEALLERLRAAIGAAGLWDSLGTDWLVLDVELLPWSLKAEELVRRQYAATGAAARADVAATAAVLDRAAARGLGVDALRADWDGRAQAVQRYVDAYRRYCWDVDGLDGVRVAPFHLLASEGAVHAGRDHGWHLELLDRLAAADPELVLATARREVDLTDPASEAAATAWWEELTAVGGEGMVVKPYGFTVRGRRGTVQPGIKCRGAEYLRIIYGPEYDRPEHLDRLRSRSLGRKRGLALREYALGIESLERFARKEPLHRVHECVFAVLALESEPVDPRL